MERKMDRKTIKQEQTYRESTALISCDLGDRAHGVAVDFHTSLNVSRYSSPHVSDVTTAQVVLINALKQLYAV